MKIYLSGPMTGIKDYNFPAFISAAEHLRAEGYTVVNPAEVNKNNQGSWHECLRADVKELAGCDCLALLPGWENSAGAHLELNLAHRLGMEITTVNRLLFNGSGYTSISFDLVRHIHRQRKFSLKTFGPGDRVAGVLDHIRKELCEIEAAPDDLEEWIDVVMLALDGAWRAGYSPEQIAAQLEKKQTKNEGRQWPDWRTAEPGKAIEHVRG